MLTQAINDKAAKRCAAKYKKATFTGLKAKEDFIVIHQLLSTLHKNRSNINVIRINK